MTKPFGGVGALSWSSVHDITDPQPKFYNGTVCFKKNVNNCLNTNIYSYLETYGGKSYNIYLNVVHFLNTSVN